MTRRFGVCLAAGLVLLYTQLLDAPPSAAGPLSGGFGTKVRIRGKGELTLDSKKSSLGDKARFKGGQRACVVVMGQSKPAAPVVLEVRDEKGNLVGRDEPARGTETPGALGNDVAAVIWYPPRDANYSITIKNLGGDLDEGPRQFWVAIK